MNEQQYKRSSPQGDSQAKMYAEAAKAEAVAEPNGSELGQGSSLGAGGFKKNWWEMLHLLPGVSGVRESKHRGGSCMFSRSPKYRMKRRKRNKCAKLARRAQRGR